MGIGSHVHGLLLCPQEFRIGIPPQLSLHQIKGEGHQLQINNIHSGVAARTEADFSQALKLSLPWPGLHQAKNKGHYLRTKFAHERSRLLDCVQVASTF